MFKVVKTQTRKSIDVQFFTENKPDSTEFLHYTYMKYVKTGKIINTSSTYSEDKLVLTTVVYFKDLDSFYDYCLDDQCEINRIAPNNLYDMLNDIVSEINCEEV